jgi:hypothetical protein
MKILKVVLFSAFFWCPQTANFNPQFPNIEFRITINGYPINQNLI